MEKHTLAMIAHDGKKDEMVEFCRKNQNVLAKFDLICTGTTGSRIEALGLAVKKVLSGPLGGDAEIAAMAANKLLMGVFFFRDPLGKHPHEPDVQMLMRVCDVHEIPLATNAGTAKYLLDGIYSQLQ
jgi:methylglyoxal synthase